MEFTIDQKIKIKKYLTDIWKILQKMEINKYFGNHSFYINFTMPEEDINWHDNSYGFSPSVVIYPNGKLYG